MRLRPCTMTAALAGLLVQALPSLPPLHAASASRDLIDKVARRPAGIEEVVDRLAAEVPAQIRSRKVLVCWLLDSTRVTRQMELHAKLADRLETVFAPMESAWKGKVFLAVCSMGGSMKPAAVLSPVSPELKPALQAVRELGTLPDDTYKNALDALRRVAKAMIAFSGRRVLVLVTLENGDTEDDLEETALFLKKAGIALHVVSREAVYSDPFFETRLNALRNYHRSYELELPYALTGLDAPAPEYPNGWIFDRSGIHEAVPSGFGTYALSRLAVLTGGTYAILSPTDPGLLPFCAEAGCSLCEGAHADCDAYYDPARLALVAPSLLPREAYRAELGKVPLARAYFETWQIAYDAGLCAMPPPWESRGGSLNPRPPRNARAPILPRPAGLKWPDEGIAWTGWDFQGSTHGGMRTPDEAKLEETARACDKAIATLENGLRTAGLPRPSIRLVGATEALICQLLATRFNLGQFRLVLADLKAVDPPLPSTVTLDGFALPALSDTRRREAHTWTFDYRNVRFCHGGGRVGDVTFLGGAPVRREQLALAERIDRVIRKYQGTPWEILTRRIGLVLIRPIAVPPPPPEDPADPNPRKRSKATDVAPQARPPFIPPVRPAHPFRGSEIAPGGLPPAAGVTTDPRLPSLTPASR